MNLENVMLSDRSQTQESTCAIIPFISGRRTDKTNLRGVENRSLVGWNFTTKATKGQEGAF